jgi:hypothetical protein
MAFEKGMLWSVFGLKRNECQMDGEKYMMRSLINVTLQQVNEDEMGRAWSTHDEKMNSYKA